MSYSAIPTHKPIKLALHLLYSYPISHFIIKSILIKCMSVLDGIDICLFCFFLLTSCYFPFIIQRNLDFPLREPFILLWTQCLWQRWLQTQHQGAVMTRSKPISTSPMRSNCFREGSWPTLGQLPKSLDFIDPFLWSIYFFFCCGCWQNKM